MLVVCTSLATLCVLNLNLSSNYATTSQSLLLCQAAVAQFIEESDRFYADSYFTSTSSKFRTPDWKTRFRKPVFPSGAEQFPGEASITFDPAAPYYSLDNSASAKPAAGWADRYRTSKSIPAYSVDLWVGVRIGGKHTRYHAVLRRRWPYVLCSGGRVKLMGTPPRLQTSDEVEAINPTKVLGDVFNVGGHVSFEESQFYDNERSVPVSYDMTDVMELTRPHNTTSRIVVGVNAQARKGPDDRFYTVRSKGNMLVGKVEVIQRMQADGAVHVAPGNVQAGPILTGQSPRNLLKILKRALRVPNVDEGTEIDAPLRAPWDRYFKVLDKDDFYRFDNSVTTRNFFYLKRNLTLPSDGGVSAEGGNPFEYSADRQFVIRGSAGNRYFVRHYDRDGLQSRSTPCKLTLNNCLLYVDGNLDLSSTEEASGTSTPAGLVGINATLVVNGNLVLAGANIDAQERGMVIYARRLVGQARGHYRGLIMVQRSLALFPPELPKRGAPAPAETTAEVQGLTVTGGVICGGEPTRLIIADDPDFNTNPNNPRPPPTRILTGLNLWSTVLEYDPQYLTTVHKFGPLTLVSLRRAE